MDLFRCLRNHIFFHPARQESLFSMVRGLCLFQSVHLRQLAYALPGSAALGSKIRRLQRFFQHQDFDYVAIGKFVLNLFILPNSITLTLDRTNWMFGKTPLNILVMGVLIDTISVPIAFTVLPKQGNSNTLERGALLKLLLKIIPASRLRCLLADREFIGQEWFKLLIKKGVPFAIRIKSTTKFMDPRTQHMTTVGAYYQSVSRGDYILGITLWGQKTYLAFKKNGKALSNVVFLAVSSEDIKASWLQKYRKRWSIERMFLSMKTHGFNLEQTHITSPERLRKLIAVIAIAFALCCKKGQFLNQKKSIPLKKHGRKLYSIFTFGLSWIKENMAKMLKT